MEKVSRQGEKPSSLCVDKGCDLSGYCALHTCDKTIRITNKLLLIQLLVGPKIRAKAGCKFKKCEERLRVVIITARLNYSFKTVDSSNEPQANLIAGL